MRLWTRNGDDDTVADLVCEQTAKPSTPSKIVAIDAISEIKSGKVDFVLILKRCNTSFFLVEAALLACLLCGDRETVVES